jgi:hypothetical protein
MSTSPGASRSMPCSSSAMRTASGMDPKNKGIVWLTAGMAWSSSGGPVIVADMSADSRMTGEKA